MCVQRKTREVVFSGVPGYQVKRMAFPDILAAFPLMLGDRDITEHE